MADNLATCSVIALEKTKKLIVAPAMNTYMYENEFVQDNFNKLTRVLGDRVKIVEPTSKMLACGVEGNGALANLSDIVKAI